MSTGVETLTADGDERLVGRTCDRGDCPAPAVREVPLAGQDFYFCNHHGAELDAVLEAATPRELWRAT